MLMAFDAAARMGSFTAAARELHLTQGAVSRQVCALENQLDITLFQRVGKTVVLTETGETYAREIYTALQAIRNASLSAMTDPLNGLLNLAILPTFGTRWLMPRLPQFLSEHPDITINFVTKLTPFDFQNENLHAAIHYGLPNWPGTDSTFLMGEEVIPVCSPKLLKQYSVSSPAELRDAPLLHLASRLDAWNSWFQTNGMEAPKGQGMLFEQFSIIAQAAMAGLGVALLPRFLIASELERGELVVVLNLPLQSSAGYYLITPADKSDLAPVAAFRHWLLKTLCINTQSES
jgi:DNA-binding transcriptional LysR family regulator